MNKLIIKIITFTPAIVITLSGCTPEVTPEKAAAQKKYRDCLTTMFMADAKFSQAGQACDHLYPGK